MLKLFGGLKKEISWFTLCGLSNLFVFYIIYFLLLHLFFYQIAYLVAYVFSILFSYWGNSFYTFKEKMTLAKLLIFLIINIFQYFVAAALLKLFVEEFMLPPFVSPLLVLAIIVPANFLVYRLIIRGKIKYVAKT